MMSICLVIGVVWRLGFIWLFVYGQKTDVEELKADMSLFDQEIIRVCSTVLPCRTPAAAS
jgi:hypothetical protein